MPDDARMWRQHVNAILSHSHETLDFIVAGSILVAEYFQLLNGNCFMACFIKEAMHGKQGSKVWCSFRSWDTSFTLSMSTIFSYLGVHPASVVQNLRQAFHSWRHWIVV